MKNNNFNFPLSFDEIANILGKNDNINLDIEGVIMVKQSSNETLNESIKEQIFKNVLDEWQSGRSVVVGNNKLLTEVNVLNSEIKEQSPALNNFVVMSIKASISIEQDPEYAKEIKDEIQSDTKHKFKR